MGTQKWFKSDQGPGVITQYDRTDLAAPKLATGRSESSAQVTVFEPVIRTTNDNYATERAFAESDEHGEQTLFRHTEWSSSPKVSSLFVDKSKGFRDLPAILGSAQLDQYQKHGWARGQLEASNDLSPYSSQIVQRAKDAGALPADSSTEVTNNYGHKDAKTGFDTFDRRKATMMSSADLAQGKGLYRAVMGRERPDHTPPMKQGRMIRNVKGQETVIKKAMPK